MVIIYNKRSIGFILG